MPKTKAQLAHAQRQRAARRARKAARIRDLAGGYAAELATGARKRKAVKTRACAVGQRALARAAEQRAATAERRVYGEVITKSPNPQATRFKPPKQRS